MNRYWRGMLIGAIIGMGVGAYALLRTDDMTRERLRSRGRAISRTVGRSAGKVSSVAQGVYKTTVGAMRKE